MYFSIPNSHQIAQLRCLCGVDPAAPSSGTNLNAGSTTYNNSNDSNHRQFSFKVSVKDHQLELQASYCHLGTKKNQTTNNDKQHSTATNQCFKGHHSPIRIAGPILARPTCRGGIRCELNFPRRHQQSG